MAGEVKIFILEKSVIKSNFQGWNCTFPFSPRHSVVCCVFPRTHNDNELAVLSPDTCTAHILLPRVHN